MKPLMEYAPFKIGERFEDGEGDVLEIVSDTEYHLVKVAGGNISIRHNQYDIMGCGVRVKPLDRPAGPKPWRDMTDDEKAPILLEWAEGKRIEWWDDVVGAWCENGIDPQRWDKLAYRIAPEDVRESVVMCGVVGDRGAAFDTTKVSCDTHKITFDTINGEPVLDSIKMERMK